MSGDGFAFAIGVRRKIDVLRLECLLAQRGQDLLFARDDDQFGIEVVVEIDGELVLRKVLDVAERGFDVEVFTEIFIDRLGLGRRFDDDEVFGQVLPLAWKALKSYWPLAVSR